MAGTSQIAYSRSMRNIDVSQHKLHQIRYWILAVVAFSLIMLGAFGLLAARGYYHVMDITSSRDDSSWILSQISYENERLLRAAETSASTKDLRLRGDIYMSRINLLRDAPAFSQLRDTAPASLLSGLFASANMTDVLIDKAGTPLGQEILLTRLHEDAPKVREWTTQLTRLNFRNLKQALDDHAADIIRYIFGFGILTLCALSAGILAIVMVRRNAVLEADRSRALEIGRMKSEFLSHMSHEIRTPLNGIIGTLQTVDDTSLTDCNRESIDIARKSSQSLLEIVNGILDVSKAQAKASTSAGFFDIRPFIADVLAHNAALIHDRDIDLLVSFDDNLPVQIYGDRLKIEQILNNLLSNAFKFTETGSVTLTLQASGQREPTPETRGAIEFTVSDTGIGISDQDQLELFEPYTQFDGKLSHRYKGTGLGLSIARQLAKDLGGDISVRSQVGKGTAFTVTIPLLATAAPEGKRNTALTEKYADPEVLLFGTHATVFRASLALANAQITSQRIVSEDEAERFLSNIPESVRALVFDGNFAGDAMAWLNGIAARVGLYGCPPIVIIRGTRAMPRVESELPITAMKERFNSSGFLHALHTAAPSLPLEGQTSAIQPSEAMNDDFEILTKLRVLVVDDSSINCRVLVRLLKNIGLSDVEAASGATQAMELLATREFDVVFMDVQMPDIDGYTATRMIREKKVSNAKIFACSAYAFEEDIKRSLEEGLDGHMPKPVDRGQLVNLLKTAVQAA